MNEDHNFGLSVWIIGTILPDSIRSEGASNGIPVKVVLLVFLVPSFFLFIEGYFFWMVHFIMIIHQALSL